MRLCLPVGDAPGGGMHSFFRNFRTYLTRHHIDFTDRLDDAWDVLVVNSWAIPYRAVGAAKRRRDASLVLHRIDGSAVDYGRDAASDVRQALVNLLADVTVFQSRYGRDATRRRRVIRSDGPIINNPVDVERFRPDGERVPLPGTLRVAHVSFSTNARKGAAVVYRLARRRPDVTFVMVGRYDDPPSLENLVDLGYIDWQRLPAVLRSCHALLILAENETCPNVVLEALASGLPVLYRDSGGTGELVGDCGAAVDAASFDGGLAQVMDRRAALAEAARQRAVETFSLEAVFPRYLETARAARRRPLPSALGCLVALARVAGAPTAAAQWVAARGLAARPRARSA